MAGLVLGCGVGVAASVAKERAVPALPACPARELGLGNFSPAHLPRPTSHLARDWLPCAVS